MAYVGSGYGSEEWGAGPWGGAVLDEESAASEFHLLRALAVRENLIRLTFSQPVSLTDLHDLFDGMRPNHWQVLPVDGTFGADGSPARPVTAVVISQGPIAAQVDLWLDRPMTPYPSRYIVNATGLFNTDHDPQLEVFSVELPGLYRGLTPQLADLVVPTRDIANPQTLSGLLDPLPNTTDARQLGTIPLDETGDVAYDEGVASYKKRVFRRLMTPKGAFAHLPNYGTLTMSMVKKLARPGLVQTLASDAEDQIRQEPETQDVRVQIAQVGILTYYRVHIQTTAGKSVEFNSPVRE